MTNVFKAALAAALACSIAGCGTTVGSTAFSAASGNPNPPPPPGYRVQCSTTTGILYPTFYDFMTGCREVIDPSGRGAVIRARG